MPISTPTDGNSRSGGIPPLQNGDCLTRAEFERRWEAMPDLKVAELIDGIVYLPETGSHSEHGRPAFDLIAWLGRYQWATPGTVGSAHGSVLLDPHNLPQPDALLMIAPERGGQARIDRYVEGAPEVVAEVTASSASYDLHVKPDVYRRNGVREYIVWRVWDREIDWFVLRDGEYVRLPLAEGIYKSAVFPGLWLDPAALVGGDLARVAQVAQQGIASEEHQQFVTRLQAADNP